MKTRYLSILMTITILLGLQHVDAQSNNLTLQYVPINGSTIRATVGQGQSIDIPVQIKTASNYEIVNILPIVSPWPDGIYATINSTFLHGIQSGIISIKVSVQPDVKPGNYTLSLIAQGWVNNTLTGNMTMVNDYPPTPINLNVTSNQGKISVKLGDMTDTKRVSFCHEYCVSFTSVEEYQVRIFSQYNTRINLSAMDVPDGKWVKFIPDTIDVGPQGVTAKMLLGGAVGSSTINTMSTKVFEIKVNSEDGNFASAYFPFEENYNLDVLHTVEPINFTNPITTNVDGNNFNTYGVVYDSDKNDSIPVNLSILGLEDNNNVVSLPSWIGLNITKTSFRLNATQIYFIMATIKTASAPVGLHDIVIDETIADRHFISNLPVQVMQPICIGGPGMCGPQPTPQEKQARTHLDFPFDVTTDSSGNTYVADSGNDRIVKFDHLGNYLMQFGISGRNDGQLMEPRGVAVDNNGNIYVADTDNDRIEKFDSNGNFLLKFGSHGTDNGQFHGPYVVTADKFGSVYVSDVGNARIQKFDSQGNFLLTFGSRGTDDGQFDELGRIAIDSSGYVYVTDITRGIQKFDSNGHFASKIPLEPTLEGNNTPDAYGITLDSTGDIFVAGNNQARIQKFDPQGNFKYEFGSLGSDPGQFNHPGSITVDNSGNILVADSDNNRIEKLDSLGKFISEIRDWNLTSIQNNQQKVPEFSFIVSVLIASFVLIFVFYRIRIRK